MENFRKAIFRDIRMVGTLIIILINKNVIGQQKIEFQKNDSNNYIKLISSIPDLEKTISIYEPGFYSEEQFKIRNLFVLGMLKKEGKIHLIDESVSIDLLGRISLADDYKSVIKNYIKYDVSIKGKMNQNQQILYLYTILNLFKEDKLIIHGSIDKSAIDRGDFFKKYIESRTIRSDSLNQLINELFERENSTNFKVQWDFLKDGLRMHLSNSKDFASLNYKALYNYYNNLADKPLAKDSLLSQFELELDSTLQMAESNLRTLKFIGANELALQGGYSIGLTYNSGSINNILNVCYKKYRIKYKGDKNLFDSKSENLSLIWFENPGDYSSNYYYYDLSCRKITRTAMDKNNFNVLIVLNKVGIFSKTFYTWDKY